MSDNTNKGELSRFIKNQPTLGLGAYAHKDTPRILVAPGGAFAILA